MLLAAMVRSHGSCLLEPHILKSGINHLMLETNFVKNKSRLKPALKSAAQLRSG